MSQDKSNVTPDYLAGFLDETENNLFENELVNNQSLRECLNETEYALEAYAHATGKSPSVDFSDAIWNTINRGDVANKPSFSVAKSSEKSGFWYSRMGIAASVLLLVSVLANIYLAQQWRYQKNNFKAVLAEKNDVKNKLKQTQEQAALSISEVSLLKNPNIKVCKLISTGRNDAKSLLLGIDMQHDMQVLVMSPELPDKPNGHSYQLWAVNSTGQMVCMGTFDAEKKIYKMKHLPFQPTEFGVTIEEGEEGMPQPTSEFLVRGI